MLLVARYLYLHRISNGDDHQNSFSSMTRNKHIREKKTEQLQRTSYKMSIPLNVNNSIQTHKLRFSVCNAKGNFRQGKMGKQCISQICNGPAFTWIRWGDGETMQATHNSRLVKAFQVASTNPRIFLNVGLWWICKQKQSWDKFAIANGTYWDDFYLDMGGRSGLNNEIGWKNEITKCNKTIIAIVPAHLETIPILKNAVFIRSPVYKNLDECINRVSKSLAQGPPAVVLIAAGYMAKIIAVELTNRNANTSIIDIGSSLDAFAGVHSRDYNNPAIWCQKTPPDQIKKLFAPGVCDRHVSNKKNIVR